MQTLLIQTRAMNLFYRHAHNTCGRVAFFADHGFFGDSYGALDDDYDSVAERLIGLTDEKAVLL